MDYQQKWRVEIPDAVQPVSGPDQQELSLDEKNVMENSSLTDVLLVGFEAQNNLGLRSIMAVLSERGWKARLLSLSEVSQQELLDAIRTYRPKLVGFSIIFQYALEDFAGLMRFLRENGVNQHFTAGGHFPSLRPEEILDAIPQLDSIVRHEGEFTLPELLQQLDHPETWQNIQGLAFRQAGRVVCSAPRHLIEDLDSLPPIDYGPPRLMGKNLKSLPVLASRGCLFDCAFCSIRQFYGGAPGSLRRMRSPEHFVNEMRRLYEQQDVRVFIFQDDDFAARTPAQRRWLEAFLKAMDRASLTGQVAWKISCRVDDLNEQVLADCKARGLAVVYLGVESGSQMGLRTLNKHVSVDQNLAAIQLLKKTGLTTGLGFMMFDPSSSFVTIQENIAFLRKAAGDGAFPINFCKMLPYAGTPIEEALRREGRLTGSLARPDYHFLDPRVDLYVSLTHRVLARRNFDSLGLANRLTLAHANQALNRTVGICPPSDLDRQRLWEITARSNASVLTTLEDLLPIAQEEPEQDVFIDLAKREWECESTCIIDLDDLLLESDPELLQFFGLDIVEREERLQAAVKDAQR